jgi:alpha-beta hydrolase superfamily lysophospholipase
MAGPAFANPQPDILGEGYQAWTAQLEPDSEGPVVATLVTHQSDAATSKAVLYLHGFSDYFHQVELAEFHAARGERFYALDLRKYGRSLLPHQTTARMSDVSDYYPELEAAVDFILADGNEQITVNAHSTGGLIAVLWLHDRRAAGRGLHPVTSVVLNSPFLDLPAAWAMRTLAPRPFRVIAKNRPLFALPSPGRSFYQLSIHRSERGEWDFVKEWKPVTGGVVRAEWLAAALRAIARAHAGLDLSCPILMMTSNKTIRTKAWTDELYRGDAVLDPDALARWSTRLGSHVTCLRIEGGMHDLLLSKPEVRSRVYEELANWMDAYSFRADQRQTDPQPKVGTVGRPRPRVDDPLN